MWPASGRTQHTKAPLERLVWGRKNTGLAYGHTIEGEDVNEVQKEDEEEGRKMGTRA